MLDTQLPDDVVNAQAALLANLLRGGFIDVMTGPKPKNAEGAIDKQRVLVTLRLSDPAFRDPQSGVIATEMLQSSEAIADGDPVWFRAYQADHKTPVMDGTVGKANPTEKFNMTLKVRTIVEGMVLGASLSHTVRKSMAGV